MIRAWAILAPVALCLALAVTFLGSDLHWEGARGEQACVPGSLDVSFEGASHDPSMSIEHYRCRSWGSAAAILGGTAAIVLVTGVFAFGRRRRTGGR